MFKSIFDKTLALFLIILFSPIYIVVSLLIFFKMGSPILFRQKRPGYKEKIFGIYKFRTMTNEKDANGNLLPDDKRLVGIGKFIRSTSLDELPQLFNVLKGEMSFVGPRPDVAGYADKLVGEDRLMLKVKPGITGPAQLKYRNEEQILSNLKDPIQYNDEILWPDKVKINVEYVKNWSFRQDLIYMFQTIFKK